MKRTFIQSGLVLFVVIRFSGNEATAQQLTAGSNGHSLAVCEQQSPASWGMNSSGQLGLSSLVSTRAVPTSVNLSSVTAVSAGNNFSLFLKNDGTVWGCGVNTDGQLGLGTTANSVFLPQQIISLSGITAIASGSNHTLFLKNDGTVWSCGKNDVGQLGDGTSTNRTVPVQVTGLTGITAIEAGGNHSLFLKSDSTVMACGMNLEGQLGTGTASFSILTPVQVSGISSVTHMSAGWAFSHFLKNDGTVRACGSNDYGQLGDGTTADKYTPVEITGIPAIAKVSSCSNGEFTLFLTADGHVWNCGINSSGHFGIGTSSGFDPNPAPVLNTFIEDVADIAAGQYHALFLKDDGTLWGSGGNAYGQLGNGTFTNTLSLVQGSELCGTTGIDDVENTIVSVYPNPGNGLFHFTSQEQVSEIRLYSLSGKLVYTESGQASEGTIDVSRQLPGIYSYEMMNGDQLLQRGKLVIQ